MILGCAGAAFGTAKSGIGIAGIGEGPVPQYALICANKLEQVHIDQT
jgi:hypothetical protein